MELESNGCSHGIFGVHPVALPMYSKPLFSPFFKKNYFYWWVANLMLCSVQFSSVAQLCPTLCNPMNCSMPGLPVHHQLPEFTHQLMSIELVMPSKHFILCHPLLLLPSIFPSIRVFSNGSVLPIRWPSIGASASASVLPMNIQDWFPLWWTSWISLQSKGLSRVFSNTTLQKHQFFFSQLSLWSNSNIHTWLLEKPSSFD